MESIDTAVVRDVIQQLCIDSAYDIEEAEIIAETRCGKMLGEVWGNISGFCNGKMTPEMAAVTKCLCYVVVESFARKRSVSGLTEQKFLATMMKGKELASFVAGAHDRIAERFIRNTLKQHALLGYLSHVLLAEDPFAAVLSPGALEQVVQPRDFCDSRCLSFLVAKSMIDVLDEEAEA